MRLVVLLVLFLQLISTFNTYTQIHGINRQKQKIHINRTSELICIDGVLDEKTWSEAEKATGFQRVLPTDTGMAMSRTEVMLAYDNSNIYIGIICYDTIRGKRPVESLRRDFKFGKNDNFIAFIDTYNDFTNGFAFGVSAAGAQWDGMQANGGFVSLDWDTKWRSAVKNYEDRWTAEFAIPFRSIRYKEGTTEWGINFSRMDLKSNEKSSWGPMPRQFQTANLAFTGSMIWDEPLPKAGPRISVIPYVAAIATQNVENSERAVTNLTSGADAKLILSTSLNLDLTVNPDFSQVEVDQQKIDLDRYELFYPEKRQFFLENTDLFANLGTDNMRPFFSRRIGLNNPVDGGARLSGNINNNWRIGLMDIQTGTRDTLLASNFSVLVLQRKVFSRSNITAFFINKLVTEKHPDSAISFLHYNRVAGLEYNLATADNRWTGKAFYHRAFFPGSTNDAYNMAGLLSYQTQYMAVNLNQAIVGKDYNAEVGYIKRTGFYEFTPSVAYKFFPSNSSLANHGPIAKVDIFFNPDLSITDKDIILDYGAEWLDRSLFLFELKNSFVKLQAPFDPTNTDGMMLPTGTSYHWNEISASYTSDTRRLFNFLLSSRYGGYYNGTKLNVYGEFYYRVQPYSSLAIIANFNKIDLPVPYKSVNLFLIGPKLDLTFTNTLFLTTYVQYNNQIDNINVNIRFQWRYAPVSDLFIVYTDNSYPEGLRSKSRGLAVKISYWFN
jgi:Domain of unknown function (DUF5916)/Carbohydrate family 9 binding domain-like